MLHLVNDGPVTIIVDSKVGKLFQFPLIQYIVIVLSKGVGGLCSMQISNPYLYETVKGLVGQQIAVQTGRTFNKVF